MNIIDNIQILAGKKPDPKLQKEIPPPRKVLIVEDDPSLSNILMARLQEEGFAVTHAENGEKGLSLAASIIPDVILLDLLMPVMTGKEMLRQLREIPTCKETPVLVLTNAGEIENIRDTLMYSDADEFMIKSNVSMDEIVHKVKTYSHAIILNQ
jgi:DNA-binding response OmpR family regulator